MEDWGDDAPQVVSSEMTNGELKEKISESLVRSLITISQDPTLGDTKIPQIRGLIFNSITGKYWDEAKKNDPIIGKKKEREEFKAGLVFGLLLGIFVGVLFVMLLMFIKGHV